MQKEASRGLKKRERATAQAAKEEKAQHRAVEREHIVQACLETKRA